MSEFSYREMHRKLSQSSANLMRSGQSLAQGTSNYYRVAPADFDPKTGLSGWEIQLAVDKADIEKAWDSIEEKLSTHKIPARVAKPNGKNSQGDAITLYVDKNNQRQWQDILQDVEQKLHDAGVKPAKKDDNTLDFEGSAYMTRRNHRNHKGEPIPVAEQKHPNPYHNDFMQGIEITPPRNPAYTRLNKMTSTLDVHMGIQGEWEQRIPDEENRIESARLVVNSQEQADQIAKAMADQKIAAYPAHKDEVIDGKTVRTHLVDIPANEFSMVSEEAVFKADKKIQAECLQKTFKAQEARGFSGLPWSVEEHPERGAYMMVRIDDPEQARSLSEFAASKTGLIASVKPTRVEGKAANYVELNMEAPQELDVFNRPPQQERMREFLDPELAARREQQQEQNQEASIQASMER